MQVVQEEDALFDWNVPKGHWVHVEAPPLFENEPALHGSQFTCPLWLE